ncbi:hypothetical protein cypCar_00030238 [Cyprinus carpio]|nr:hypothetical protein cypCar_00030238 [Cyprinus carpio]
MAKESTGTETARILENEKNTDVQSGEEPKTTAQNADTPTNAKKHKKKKKKTGKKRSVRLKTIDSSKCSIW